MKLMDSSAAKKALNDKKVTGIIYTEDASLVVDENSYNATILESILTQYKQQKNVFTNIAKTKTGGWAYSYWRGLPSLPATTMINRYSPKFRKRHTI
jgi:hypothetical protein